jgi:phage gpG-like protein
VDVIFDPGNKFRRIRENLEEIEWMMDVSSITMLAASDEAFRTGEFKGKGKWPDHPVPRWQNIMADLISGRNEPRPGLTTKGRTLVDTGALWESLTWERIGKYEMAVGSNLPYAGKLHKGGEDEIGPWSADVRNRLWEWLKAEADHIRSALGWLLNKKWMQEPVTFVHPARPIVALTPTITEKILEDIQYFLAEGWDNDDR